MRTVSALMLLLCWSGCGGRDPLEPAPLSPPVDAGSQRAPDVAVADPIVDGGVRDVAAESRRMIGDAPPAGPRPDARPAPVLTCALPQCLEVLAAMCSVGGGACVRQNVGTDGSNVCFANGVKIFTRLTMGPNGWPNLDIRVLREDGNACFAVRSLPAGPSTGSDLPIEYLQRDGQQIASAVLLPRGLIEVTCPGEPPRVVDPSCQPGVIIPGGTAPLMCCEYRMAAMATWPCRP
jgi:hypothetical protein